MGLCKLAHYKCSNAGVKKKKKIEPVKQSIRTNVHLLRKKSYFYDEVSCSLIRNGALVSVKSIKVALKSILAFQVLFFFVLYECLSVMLIYLETIKKNCLGDRCCRFHF